MTIVVAQSHRKGAAQPVASTTFSTSFRAEKGREQAVITANFRVGVGLVASVTIVTLVLTFAQAATPLSGRAISESYRAEFGRCDASNIFAGVHFPIRRANGRILWYGCLTDPSRFTRFEAIEATSSSPAAVLVESKLGHDEDGSFAPCHHAGGVTDQCATSLMLKATPQHQCLVPHAPDSACVPLDADAVPYVVIPAAAPRGIDARAFSRLSKVGVGDYGVVIVAGKVRPAIVGDEGPAYKIGEGSSALLKALSEDGRVHTYGSHVVFVLFPGSADARASLSPDTIANVTLDRAMALYGRLTGGN